jgi:hypothetical protein
LIVGLNGASFFEPDCVLRFELKHLAKMSGNS